MIARWLLPLAIFAGVAALVTGLGYVLGGWDFIRQHEGALLAAAVMLTLTGSVAVALVRILRRGVTLAVRRRRALDQSGAAAAEFVITVIPFMLMLLGIMQMALISMARVLVGYSAFCAARAAIVYIPIKPDEAKSLGGWIAQAFTSELQNRVGFGSDSRFDLDRSNFLGGKMSRIRNAAVYALIPASPAIDVFAEDAAAGWNDYIKNKQGKGMSWDTFGQAFLDDLKNVPKGIINDIGYQIKKYLQKGFTNPENRQQAKDSIGAYIDKNVSDKSTAAMLKNFVNTYIDRYNNSGAQPLGYEGQQFQNFLNNLYKDPMKEICSLPADLLQSLGTDSRYGKLSAMCSGSTPNPWANPSGVPISPGGDAGGSGPDTYAVNRALDSGFAAINGPLGAIGRSLRKFIYAKIATAVVLLNDPGAPNYVPEDPTNSAGEPIKTLYNWDEPVRVRVTYLFYCQIPLANRFAGKPYYDLPDNVVLDLTTGGVGPLAVFGMPGYFLPLTAEHTLQLQGKP
jgi:hypothetical protein